MNFSYKRSLKVLTLLLGLPLLFSGIIKSQGITFQVNMEHAYLQSGDKVVVRGNIESLGNWEDKGQLTLRKQRNTDVFTGTLNLARRHSGTILYKYVIIRRDGTEQWEERGNRILNPANPEMDWFEDRQVPGIQQTLVKVTFRLDLTEHSMNGYPAEGVALMGGHAPLSWELETGRTPMTEISEGIWTATVNFPYGTPDDVPFKFAWKHNDEWIWEWRAGHSNHVFLIDDSGNEQTIALRYDVEKPGVVPAEGTTGSVDNYDAVLARLADKAGQSRYQYEKAMMQLKAGNLNAATQTYAVYKAAHPGGEEIDDFAYQMVYALEKAQGYEAAKAYLDTQKSVETIPERKVYFEYLEGELALNAGRPEEARKAFKQVMKNNNWDIATDYSRRAMVHSYLTEEHPDSVKKGVKLLEEQAARAPQAQKRELAVRLSRAYRAAGMKKEQEQALIEVATSGTERQRASGKIELARTYLRHNKFTEALGFLDAVNEELLTKRDKLQKMRLQIELYHQLEMHGEVAALFEQYERAHPNDPYRKRLEGFKQNAERQLGADKIDLKGPEDTVLPDSTQNRN